MIKYISFGLALALLYVAGLTFTVFHGPAGEHAPPVLGLAILAVAGAFFLLPFAASVSLRSGRPLQDLFLGASTAALLFVAGVGAPWFIAAAFCLLALLGGYSGRQIIRALET